MENQEQHGTLLLTDRFTRAVEYAQQVHIGYRKGTMVPYMAHLLGVASLVMGETGHIPFPVTEDMVIAALLHDAVEDAGGMPRLRHIEANFGTEVARIVEDCTDSFAEESSHKEDWEARKSAYLERLPREPDSTLLVSAADKLYNARAILEEYREIGPRVWDKFKRGRRQQMWYFDRVIEIYDQRGSNRIVTELKRVVEELRRLSEHDL